MRHGPTARLAHPDDLSQVVELLRMARAESPLGPQLCSPDCESLRHQLTVWQAMPGAGLLVAEQGTDILGVALSQYVEANLFSDVAYLQLEALFVAAAHRRRGVGRLLMSMVAHVAFDRGASHVVTMPLSGSRSEQRFLSGLGFSPAATRRIVETPMLQRRLEFLSGPRRTRGIDEIIARRRRSRGLPPTPPSGVSIGARSSEASHAGG